MVESHLTVTLTHRALTTHLNRHRVSRDPKIALRIYMLCACARSAKYWHKSVTKNHQQNMKKIYIVYQWSTTKTQIKIILHENADKLPPFFLRIRMCELHACSAALSHIHINLRFFSFELHAASMHNV